MKMLKELREQRKITQQQLADLLQIPRTTLAHYESGRNEMSYDLLCRSADYFNVSVDFLLGREQLFSDARVPYPEIIELYNQMSDSEKQILLGYARGMLAVRK